MNIQHPFDRSGAFTEKYVDLSASFAGKLLVSMPFLQQLQNTVIILLEEQTIQSGPNDNGIAVVSTLIINDLVPAFQTISDYYQRDVGQNLCDYPIYFGSTANTGFLNVICPENTGPRINGETVTKHGPVKRIAGDHTHIQDFALGRYGFDFKVLAGKGMLISKDIIMQNIQTGTMTVIDYDAGLLFRQSQEIIWRNAIRQAMAGGNVRQTFIPHLLNPNSTYRPS